MFTEAGELFDLLENQQGRPERPERLAYENLGRTGRGIVASLRAHDRPEAEAANNFAEVLARVRAGVEIVIGDEARPVAVVRSAEPHVRLLSESLRLAKEHASTATLDEDFARDLEAVINSHREPLNPPAWD